MSKNTSSILLWNAVDCPADSSECIYNISKLLKVNFTSIIVLANDHTELTPDLSDAATTLPIVIRCGEHAIHDAIVDVVQTITTSSKYNFVIVSNEYSIWIDIVQRVKPANLVFVSKNDPRQSLSFSFLPDAVKYTILQWPSLREIIGDFHGIELVNDDTDEIQNQPKLQKRAPPPQHQQAPIQQKSRQQIPQQQMRHQQQQQQQQQPDFDSQQYSENDYNSDGNNYDENEEDINEGNNYAFSKKNQQKVNFNQRPSPVSERIKPLSNLEKHQIDLRSPIGSSKPQSVDTKLQYNRVSKDQQSVPLEFQPLIEAMKSIGKSMVSLSDLEEQFNICCKNLNLPPQDLKTMIDKASSNGLIIFDSNINYVRFKNRQITNSQIVYT